MTKRDNSARRFLRLKTATESRGGGTPCVGGSVTAIQAGSANAKCMISERAQPEWLDPWGLSQLNCISERAVPEWIHSLLPDALVPMNFRPQPQLAWLEKLLQSKRSQ